MNKILILAMLCAIGLLPGIAVSQTNTATDMTSRQLPAGPVVDITTSLGDIRIKLYDDTPKHRDNFLKLVGEGFYNGVLFHRVIKNFMVQTGDPDSKNAASGARLGGGDPGYTIEAEIVYPKYFHKYGALAAARTGDEVNPERRSSGSQFYIVTGDKYSADMLKQFSRRIGDKAKQQYFNKLVLNHKDEIVKLQAEKNEAALEELRLALIKETEENVKDVEMTPEAVEAYTSVGGTPHLDGEYTVFGEVISGMDVVEKIQNATTDSSDRPVEDIRIISAKVEKQ